MSEEGVTTAISEKSPKSLSVSALVVNYNGAACLGRCIESLKREPLVNQIVVVDNGSTDGSDRWLQDYHPDVVYVPAGANIGFGRGCNMGAQVATESLLLLLNYDAELLPGLGQAIEHLAAFPKTAMVGGRLASGDGSLQPSVGNPHTPLCIATSWLGLGRLMPKLTFLLREIEDPTYYKDLHIGVAWVSGALMLVRKSAWTSIGGMDPGYFLYLEDVDICERLVRVGWRLDYLPTFRANHQPRQGEPVVSVRALLSTVDSSHRFLSSRHGLAVARATCFSLGAVFSLRALILALCFWRPSPFRESRVFIRGSLRALGLAFGRAYPWGPVC